MDAINPRITVNKLEISVLIVIVYQRKSLRGSKAMKYVTISPNNGRRLVGTMVFSVLFPPIYSPTCRQATIRNIGTTL